MRIFFWIVIGLFSISDLLAVGAITQVKLIEIWCNCFEEKYTQKEKQQFILGALFKNIEYLNDISHSIVWKKGVTLKDVYNARSAFEAGEKFSSYVHEKKLSIVKRWGIEQLITGISPEFIQLFLSLLEDETVHSVRVCMPAVSALSGISEEEILTGINIEQLVVWHGILYKYFKGKPSESLLLLKHDNRIRFPELDQTIDTWCQALVFFGANKKIQNYVNDMLLEFENSFEFFKLKLKQGN